MKITKFVHSCLLVEMPEPINRTALFDPGTMSESALDVDSLEYLDDILITHIHADHMSVDLIKQLVAKFPEVRITAPADAVEALKNEGITASSQPPEGVIIFEAPHEKLEPFMMAEPPDELGYHYLELLSDPGDSHSFSETKEILALPIQAPWGSTRRAVELALELKPKYVIPIHDWHWSDDARRASYNNLEKIFADNGITFLKPETGESIVLDV